MSNKSRNKLLGLILIAGLSLAALLAATIRADRSPPPQEAAARVGEQPAARPDPSATPFPYPSPTPTLQSSQGYEPAANASPSFRLRALEGGLITRESQIGKVTVLFFIVPG